MPSSPPIRAQQNPSLNVESSREERLPPVYVQDYSRERAQAIMRVVAASGSKPRPLEEALSQRDEEASNHAGVAVLVLGGPASRESALERLRLLKRRGFKVICCEEGARTRSLVERCEVLLAGALALLDSAREGFAEELLRLLAPCVKAERERREEEERLRRLMAGLGVVGESQAMMSVFRWVVRASALSDIPTLITGETGTGKELLVGAIARLDAKRSRGPFVALNCSALSAGLAESELFGHRRGAFTGAVRDRKGLFRSAEGGILFLDEIGDLDEHLQMKLLRVMQESRVLGVGEDREVRVDVRVIAATNRNLEEMVAQKKFRADLFHRLNTITLNVPPLRERPADFKPLVEHFVRKHLAEAPFESAQVDSEFTEALKGVRLPGNVRQLGNLVRQALFNKTDDGPLGLGDLPPAVWRELLEKDSEARQQRPAPLGPETASARTEVHELMLRMLRQHDWNLSLALKQCERVLVEAALEHTHGNQTQTAHLLGISPRSVYNKLRKHQLH